MTTGSPSKSAREAFAMAEAKEKTSFESQNKFGFAFMMIILACSAILPFIAGKKVPGIVDILIYEACLLGIGLTWAAIGYLHGRRIYEQVQEMSPLVAAWTSLRWGRPVEIVLYYGVYFVLNFAVLVWGHHVFGYLGFNLVLLFVMSAMACLVMPIWMVGLNVVLILLVLRYTYGLFLDIWVGWDNLVGIGMGLTFGAMMYSIVNRQIATRMAAGNLARELDTANAQLRAYSAKAEELSATQERNRIAREIHDTLGHSLTVVNVQLEAAKALIPTDVERASQFIDKAKNLTQKGLQDVRESVSSLRASPLDGKSISQALEELAKDLSETGVYSSFSVNGEEAELSPQIASAVYRTAQEAMTNVRKHSQAKSVDIALDFRSSNSVQLFVEDDGIGCQDTDGGFGILGIQERVQFLNGKTQIKTSTGNGFRLEVSIPV